MKKISILIMIFLSALIIKAQNEYDALRYSNLNLLGTSRYLGMGGAFGAVGADMSTLSSNPAGIALFRRSEFSFTPAFSEGVTKSDYLGKSNNDNKFNFALNNIGIVLASKNLNDKSEESDKSISFQLGFAVNRYYDFNNRVMIKGRTDKSSLVNDYVNNADNDGFTPDYLNPYDTQLAYNAHLITTNPPGNTSYISCLYNGSVDQRLSKTFSGSSNESLITIGANYDDRLYLGATVGFPHFSYKEQSNYAETNLNAADSIKSYNVHENLSESGSGFNIKFGAIYRISDWMRLGAAVHSPSFYKVDRSFTRDLQSNLTDFSYDVSSPQSDFSYYLQTPAHYLGSLAFIIKKKAVIGLDYEFVDYTTMKLRDNSEEWDYSTENSNIQNLYTYQHNLRVGGELMLAPLAIRAGFGISTGPYADNNLFERRNISLGLGFRDKDYSFDIGYMYSFYKQDYYLYQSVPLPSNNTITNQTLSFTFGYKF